MHGNHLTHMYCSPTSTHVFEKKHFIVLETLGTLEIFGYKTLETLETLENFEFQTLETLETLETFGFFTLETLETLEKTKDLTQKNFGNFSFQKI